MLPWVIEIVRGKNASFVPHKIPILGSIMDYQEHKAKLMQNPKFRKAYEALGVEYQRRRKEARLRADLVTAGIEPGRYLGGKRGRPPDFIHSSSNWANWVCMICGKNYKYYGALLNHVKKYHPGNIERL